MEGKGWQATQAQTQVMIHAPGGRKEDLGDPRTMPKGWEYYEMQLVPNLIMGIWIIRIWRETELGRISCKDPRSLEEGRV